MKNKILEMLFRSGQRLLSGNLFVSTITRSIVDASNNERDEKRTSSASACGPGRMCETETVKGRDCSLPREQGIYRHVDKKTGKVDYAGQTDNLRVRQQQHVSSGKLNLNTHKIAYSPARSKVTKDDLCNTEKKHIYRHKPTGNKYTGGNGRR